MKRLLLLATLLIGFTSLSQEPEPDLIQTWYLHSITIEDIDYSPIDYGFYPDIVFEEFDEIFSFSIVTPSSVGCIFNSITFSENPTTFQLTENQACLTKPKCYDGPEGPCSQIYGMHADFYLTTLETPLNYNLITNEDETQTLEVTNENGNVSLYGDEPLLQTSDFSENDFNIYPNPVSETLFIISENNTIKKLNVYSINGHLILSEKNDIDQLDVSVLSNGLYFVEITSEKGTAVQKFIKQ